MTLKGYNSWSQSFDSKYLETVTDTILDPGRTFLKVAIDFRLAPSDLTLDDSDGDWHVGIFAIMGN